MPRKYIKKGYPKREGGIGAYTPERSAKMIATRRERYGDKRTQESIDKQKATLKLTIYKRHQPKKRVYFFDKVTRKLVHEFVDVKTAADFFGVTRSTVYNTRHGNPTRLKHFIVSYDKELAPVMPAVEAVKSKGLSSWKREFNSLPSEL